MVLIRSKSVQTRLVLVLTRTSGTSEGQRHMGRGAGNQSRSACGGDEQYMTYPVIGGTYELGGSPDGEVLCVGVGMRAADVGVGVRRIGVVLPRPEIDSLLPVGEAVEFLLEGVDGDAAPFLEKLLLDVERSLSFSRASMRPSAS